MKAKELQELGQWKVGMRVLHTGSSIGGESIYTVSRITDGRGGTIYIGNDAYDIEGSSRGGSTWHHTHISPATAEDIQRIKGKVANSYLRNYDWQELTGEQSLRAEEALKFIGIDIRVK